MKLWPRCKEEAALRARSTEKALVSSAAGNNDYKSKKGEYSASYVPGIFQTLEKQSEALP